jgi:hypothetical protein
MTPTEYLHNIEMRYYTLFRVENGKGFYVLNDVCYTRKEFDKLYPMPLAVKLPSPNWKGENIDKTKDWLYEN